MEPEKPSLCISVIGGAKNFVLEGHKKEVFYSVRKYLFVYFNMNCLLIWTVFNIGLIN